jgi:hydroxyethylthiazole kinase-like uncharacterized protein yjeF
MDGNLKTNKEYAMKKVFDEVGTLDRRCYEEFGLTEDILMEHAASSMAKFCEEKFETDKTILVVCGVGNNGADGIALARLLYKKFDVKLYIPFGLKSQMAKLQLKRVKLLGLEEISFVCSCDIVVDCLFGSGLNKDLDESSIELLKRVNYLDAYKIACDIPSGISSNGEVRSVAFKADTTITMGAYKKSLFSDTAKNYVGDILVSDLGVQREVYETSCDTYLLEKTDMKLPFRKDKNSHKGTFGHATIIMGEKCGAGRIACDAAFKFGAGLVTAVSHKELNIPCHIMQSHFLPKNCTSIAIGMGLGNYENEEIKNILALNIPKVIDADLFYEELIVEALNKELVITPHPKEFCSLLKLCDIVDIDVETLQKNRFKYIDMFTKKYSSVTILLKGANTIIAKDNKRFINNSGTPNLSKGGSGDVLSGLIASLLAQGYNCLDATITASLAHSFAAQNFTKNSYALTPQDIIDEVTKL